MSKTKRNQSLLLAASMILMVLIGSSSILIKNTRAQFEEQYTERLHSGLTTFGILLNYAISDFSNAIEKLSVSEALRNQLSGTLTTQERSNIISENALQLGVDALYYIAHDGRPLASYNSASSQPPSSQTCFANLGKIALVGEQLFFNKAGQLRHDGANLGFLCASMAIATPNTGVMLASLVRGEPFVVHGGQAFFFSSEFKTASMTELASDDKPGYWTLKHREFLSKRGGLTLDYDTLEIGLLIENNVFKADSHRAMAAMALSLLTMIALAVFSLRTLHRQHRTQHKLNKAKEQAMVTLSSIADCVITIDAKGKITFINDAAEALLGHKRSACNGRAWDDIFQIKAVHDGHYIALLTQCQGMSESLQSAEDMLLITASEDIPIRYTAAPISRLSLQQGFVFVIHDISREYALKKTLAWRAHHDELTGLPNRHSFYERLELELENLQGTDSYAALLYLDLDHFKVVNDTCGHAAGDQLLQAVCELMRQQLREGDLLGRLGGDEFAIILPQCSILDAQQIGEKLVNALNTFRFDFDEHQFQIGVSIGASLLDQHSGQLCDVIRNADGACYDAKHSGRNCVSISKAVAMPVKQRAS